MKTVALTVRNLGIITDNPEEVISDLSNIFGLTQPIRSYSNQFDLLIQRSELTVTKYWVFCRDSLSQDNGLLSTFLEHCSEVFEMERCSCDGMEWLRSKITH